LGKIGKYLPLVAGQKRKKKRERNRRKRRIENLNNLYSTKFSIFTMRAAALVPVLLG
jgi:hypothetical protein